MIYLDIEKKIEIARKILYNNIEKYGMKSEEAELASIELDKLLNIYYSKNKYDTVKIQFEIAWEELKKYTIKKEFPCIEEWNEYALDNSYISAERMILLLEMDWQQIKNTIYSEIQMFA